MAVSDDQPLWPIGRIERTARELLGPQASVFRDLNTRHPVVAAFGKFVIARFVNDDDAASMAPLRREQEVARADDWGSAFGLARDALREGLADHTTCPHPPPRVSLKDDLGFCRACSSWRGSTGQWLPPMLANK